ncbi:tripartite ATP-independent transporter DctP family solute receptor [Aliiruegeria haliotis]|uniref:Tripartite ATP-independent transporter DctP family solute receptor n=1 Tax=Aliiruegeria haliotis TaxID=1280846 RepID=A0A2T0RDX3_9RHOB|nr:TRAP transporter substrate-binding protein [Aliiruegeria haliotis]PRY19341.1 tripartite ATP-independent transporter DctP family solute receptor [Aliiruegeria haliotis]
MTKLTSILGAIALVGSVATAATAADVTLRYSYQNPPSHPLGQAAEKFAEAVKEKSNGEIEVALFPGGQLGGPKDLLQNLQMGVLDMTMAKPGVLGDMGAPKLNILSMPYIFTDSEHQGKVLFGPIGEELLGELDQINLAGVGFFVDSPRHFFFRDKPVEEVPDMAGLKMRSMTGKIFVDMMKSFDTSPTPMPFGELYLALQSGVVDGADQPLTGYYANKFHEVSKHVILDGHDASPTMILMSKMSWDKLTDSQKQAVREAHKIAADFFLENETKMNAEIIDTLTEKGITVVPVEDKTPWIAAVQPMYDEYADLFGDLVERIRAVE